MRGRNRRAFDETLRVLRQLGRVDPIDAAEVAAVRSLADAVDGAPDNAQLWRQYREALAGLTKADDVVDSSLAEALAAIRGASPVGDPAA